MTINVRHYRDSDDFAARALEAKAAQHRQIPILSKLVKVYPEFTGRYDTKARLYENHIAVVAEDTTNNFICGGCCVGIKRVYYQGEIKKAGYLFDLRVHEDYQRRGVGAMINTAVESACKEAEVDFIYFTVNMSNMKARAFYKKFQYIEACQRKLSFTPLLFTKPNTAKGPVKVSVQKVAVTIRPVSAKEFNSLASNFYNQADLALVNKEGNTDFSCLLESDRYVGSWVAEPSTATANLDKSWAAVVLMNGDGFAEIKIERLIFAPDTWKKSSTILATAAICLFVVIAWSRNLWFSYQSESFIPFTFVVSVVFLLIVLAVGGLVLALVLFCTSRTRTRARIVAPIISGPMGHELFAVLKKYVQSVASAEGFAFSILNLDTTDALVVGKSVDPVHGKKVQGTTMFMLKCFTGTQQPFKTHNFFDPRDLA